MLQRMMNKAGWVVLLLAGVLGGSTGAVAAPCLQFAEFHVTVGAILIFCTMGIVLGLLPSLLFGLPALWASDQLSPWRIRLFFQFISAGATFCAAAALGGWAAVQFMWWLYAAV